MGISHGAASSLEQLSLSPLGDACSRMDLTAIHEILEKVGYKDDEGTANEVCVWGFYPIDKLEYKNCIIRDFFHCSHCLILLE